MSFRARVVSAHKIRNRVRSHGDDSIPDNEYGAIADRFPQGTLADYNEKTGGKVIKIILVAALPVGLSACVPPSAPTPTPPSVGYYNASPSPPPSVYPAQGYPAPYSPSTGYYGRSVVSLQLVE